MDGPHPTICCLGPTTDSSKQEGPGQGREDLRRQLTRFQPARRGTQNASRRVEWRSFARVAHPGCSSRLGLRDTRTRSATSGQGHPHDHPGTAVVDWPQPTCPQWAASPPKTSLPSPQAAHTRGRAGSPSPGLQEMWKQFPTTESSGSAMAWGGHTTSRLAHQQRRKDEKAEAPKRGQKAPPNPRGGGDAPRQGASPHTHPLLPWAWGPVALKTQIISLRLPPRESSRSPDPVKLPPHSCNAPSLPTPPWTSLCHNH